MCERMCMSEQQGLAQQGGTWGNPRHRDGRQVWGDLHPSVNPPGVLQVHSATLSNYKAPLSSVTLSCHPVNVPSLICPPWSPPTLSWVGSGSHGCTPDPSCLAVFRHPVPPTGSSADGAPRACPPEPSTLVQRLAKLG